MLVLILSILVAVPGTLEVEFADIDRDIVDADVDTHNEKHDDCELGGIKTLLATLSKDVKGLQESNEALQHTVDSLSNRVQSLEGKVFDFM